MTPVTPSRIPVVQLTPADEPTQSLWRDALSLMRELPAGWTLVGGMMVQLHAARAGHMTTRTTVDIDILADSRSRPSATERVGEHLTQVGFTLDEESILRNPPTAFRFRRGNLIVDLLAPDHTGWRRPPLSVNGFQTIQAAGGTQALERTGEIQVRLDGIEARVRCPSLLGAILMKARAIHSGRREQDRDDMATLLACIEEPLATARELRPSERTWLRRIERSLDVDRSGAGSRFSAAQAERIMTTYRLLTRRDAQQE